MNGTNKTTEQLLEEIGQLESKITGLQKSVDQHERTEKTLQASEERYRGIIQSTVNCIAVYKPIENGQDFVFIDLNPMAEKVEQLSKDEVIGKKVTDVFPGIIELGLLKFFQEVWKTGKPINFPLSIYKDVRIQGYKEYYVYKLSSGEIVAVYQDYTEHKKIEEQLRSSEERLKIIFESAPDAIYIHDLKGKFLDGNKAAEDMLGYEREELIGSNFLKLKMLSARGLIKASALLVKNLQGKGTGPTEFVLNHKDGRQIPVEISTFPVEIKGQTVVLGIARDISERKQAEKLLQKSEERFRAVVENSHSGILIVGDDFKFDYVNDQLCKILGRKPEEIISHDFREFLDKDSKKIVEDRYVRRQREEDVLSNYEFNIVRKDGEIRRVEISSTIVIDSKGLIWTIGQLLDITERKRTEESLRSSEERYRTLFMSSPVETIIVDMDGKILAFNKAIEESNTRLPETESLMYVDYACKYKFDLHSELIDCIKSGIIKKYTDLEYGDNHEFFNITIAPYYDGAIIISENITERKRAEQVQRVLYNVTKEVSITDNLEELIVQIQKELKPIIDTSNYYVAFHDKETNAITFPYYADEYDKFTMIPSGKSLTHYVIETKKPLLANIEVKKRLVREGKLEHVGSITKVWLGVPLKVEGQVTGVLAVQSYSDENAFDESDMEILEYISSQLGVLIYRKKAEQELLSQNYEYASLNKEYETQNKLLTLAVSKAEESDRLKSAFLANMSHEIRTPMNGILGFSELLKEPGLSGEDQSKYISVIEKSGARMLSTINDLIEMSKLEAGQMIVSISEVKVNEQLEYIYNFFKPELEGKGLQFTYSKSVSESEVIINTDGEKLYGIMTNLVKNAIKYTNEGSIEFGCSLKENFAEFFVKDTGIGISDDRQQAVFERFVQADISKSKPFEGSGLGLAISKAYVELLGGKIWVESEEGKGSIFYFTIPATTANSHL